MNWCENLEPMQMYKMEYEINKRQIRIECIR